MNIVIFTHNLGNWLITATTGCSTRPLIIGHTHTFLAQTMLRSRGCQLATDNTANIAVPMEQIDRTAVARGRAT